MIKSNSKGKNITVKIKKTRENKLRNIKKMLKKAKGKAITSLNERMNYWHTK
jgi:hypothetical protein